jgi:hypothetical protein
MAELLSGGYAVEYICRIVDETGGSEAVPSSGTSAVSPLTNSSSPSSAPLRNANAAKTAGGTNTKAIANAALNVATPVLNAVTNGVAGNVIGKTKMLLNLGTAIATGASFGGVVGAAASVAAWGVTEIVNFVSSERSKNDAIAQSLDDTNFMRMAAGLDKIEYSQSSVLRRISYDNNRF